MKPDISPLCFCVSCESIRCTLFLFNPVSSSLCVSRPVCSTQNPQRSLTSQTCPDPIKHSYIKIFMSTVNTAQHILTKWTSPLAIWGQRWVEPRNINWWISQTRQEHANTFCISWQLMYVNGKVCVGSASLQWDCEERRETFLCLDFIYNLLTNRTEETRRDEAADLYGEAFSLSLER